MSGPAAIPENRYFPSKALRPAHQLGPGAPCCSTAPSPAPQAIAQYGIELSGGPNFAFDLCTRKVRDEDLQGLDLGSWKVAFVGAEPIHPHTLRDFAARFAPCGLSPEALYPCYGVAPLPPLKLPPFVSQGCRRREGTSEAAREAVRQAVGGWRLGAVTNAMALAVRGTAPGHGLGALEG